MSRAHPRFTRRNPVLPPPTGNLFEVIVQGLLEGQMTINTFYYMDGGGVLIATSEQNVYTGWIAAFWTTYLAAVSADWTVTQVKVQCLSTPTRVPYVATPTPAAGTGPAGHEPTVVAAVCVRYSTFSGQAGRGRFYMPAVPTSWVTASTITAAAALVAYSGAASIGGTGFSQSGVTYTAQVVSKRNKTAGNALGSAPTSRVTFRLLLGTVRRRRIGRGK